MGKLSIQLYNCKLQLFYEGDTYNDVDDAEENGEARHQLYEGKEYEYVLPNGIYFEPSAVIKPSRRNPSEGSIITGNYVGTLDLKICNDNGEFIDIVTFEVQSQKTNYRSDYRKMLNDITNYYTELVMMSGSPVSQKFEPSTDDDQRTLYQKFAFVKSIIDSDEFDESINKILYNPVKRWTDTVEERSISSVKRLGRDGVRQIVTSTNRIQLPNGQDIAGLRSLPRSIQVKSKEDTVDTQENRFVKFVLQTFAQFCDYIYQISKHKSERLEREAHVCCIKLESYLNYGFFKEVKQAQFVALNSPILQRKEGYREILQAWTLFDLAAKLTWQGGDNVYKAGSKNVATLYEYWLFFKLMEIISDLFSINPKDKSALVETDSDKINLNVKQGRMIMVGGIHKTPTRNINVRFFYNRTFSHNSEIGKRGSWTTPMRPDYTLSIWPGDISEDDAESQNIIVHIHFDAKYKVNQIAFPETETEEQFDEEKEQESVGIYKRADILKMHAYNDAIRRTGGSYVLYPGTVDKTMRGFHEIIPGLGAFSISPNSFDQDSKALKQFLKELLAHFMNRVSKRERKAFHDYDIETHTLPVLCEPLPEPFGRNRNLIPNETNIIVAFYRTEGQLKWILGNKKYNARTGTQRGSLRLNHQITTAKYILLHSYGDAKQLLLRISDKGVRVMSKDKLIDTTVYQREYKPSHSDYYIVFDLEQTEPDEQFKNVRWDIPGLLLKTENQQGNQNGVPFGVSLADLMKYVVR